MSKSCLEVGVAGIGGFAYCHHEVLLELEEEGLLKVRATCDPKAASLTSVCEHFAFEPRGVRVAGDFAAMFSQPLDLVTIAAPIHLHASMHRLCVEGGAACYLEKPPTLDPVELRSMIETDQKAAHGTHVGFHLLHQPERLKLKKRMIDGEFGPMRRATFLGAWRRPVAYFQRNSWAGRLTMGETLLLDSCVANAMAHYVNAALFFAGSGDLHAWASPVTAEAELYRANAIEGTDTVFARALLDNGVECRIAATHACSPSYAHREIYEFEKARVEIKSGGEMVVTDGVGKKHLETMSEPSLTDNMRGYVAYLRDEADRPSIRLVDCEPFVKLNALLYLAAPCIADIPKAHLLSRPLPEIESSVVEIENIEVALENFAAHGRFPSESGVPWARPGGSSKVEDIPRLPEALRALLTHAPKV